MGKPKSGFYTVYPLEILQKVLDRLWTLADENGYVLMAPKLIMQHGGDIITVPAEDGKAARLTGNHLSNIYESLMLLGVVRVTKFKTGYSPIRIPVVLRREIDPNEYKQLPVMLMHRRLNGLGGTVLGTAENVDNTTDD